MPAITLFVYLGVSWWASWYPAPNRRRRRYRAAVFPPRRARWSVRDALVQHRALRGPAVAVDLPRWRRLVLYRTSWTRESKCVDADGSTRVPAGAARHHARGLRGSLHVHHRHAAQLGARRMSSTISTAGSAPRHARNRMRNLTAGHHRADAASIYVTLHLASIGRETPSPAPAPAACCCSLVLVADQRVVEVAMAVAAVVSLCCRLR